METPMTTSKSSSLLQRPAARLLAGLGLALAAACGETAPEQQPPKAPPAARGIDYVGPAAGGWKLVRNQASTTTRLVLDLVGPAGVKTRGVGFNLKAPAGLKFSAFENGLPINDTGVYKLHAANSLDPSDPVALTGGVKPGNLLTVGIFQKDRDQGAQDSGVPLCQIALVFDPGGYLAQGAVLPLTVTKAKILPEDIGDIYEDPYFLDKKLNLVDIKLSVGTVTVN
jgi:hypothetical protein